MSFFGQWFLKVEKLVVANFEGHLFCNEFLEGGGNWSVQDLT